MAPVHLPLGMQLIKKAELFSGFSQQCDMMDPELPFPSPSNQRFLSRGAKAPWSKCKRLCLCCSQSFGWISKYRLPASARDCSAFSSCRAFNLIGEPVQFNGFVGMFDGCLGCAVSNLHHPGHGRLR